MENSRPHKIKHELSLLVLENTHTTFKILWQILMGLALAVTVNSFYGGLTDLIATKNSGWIHSTAVLSANFAVFMLTFLRFFWGDNRYLDLHYMELFLQISQSHPDKIDEELNRISGERRFFDIILLTVHGTIFIFLGLALENYYHFYLVYAILMTTNVLWLFYNKHLQTRKEVRILQEDRQGAALGFGGTKVRYSQEVDPNYAPRFWIRNNIATLVVMGSIFAIYELTTVLPLNVFQYMMIGTCLANCFIDFWKTWDFYFPKLGELIFPDIETDTANE